VAFDPDGALVVNVVPTEAAHVQERLLMPALLQQAQRGELWLTDCNFSTRAILGGWAALGACFIVHTPRRAVRRAHAGASTRARYRSSRW
jgi:hypothetical protein